MRQRKGGPPGSQNGSGRAVPPPPPTRRPAPRLHIKPQGFNFFSAGKVLLGCIVLLVASYFGYRGYLETRVNTPFDNEKVVQNSGLAKPDMFWGSYRPGTYFGMKTRDPHSLVMGLMWFFPRQALGGGKGIRHWCEIGDNLQRYGWTHHDGRTFGVQELYDGAFKLETSFIKTLAGPRGGEWTARIRVTNITAITEDISLLWYTALDEKTNGWIKPVHGEELTNTVGQTLGLGNFEVKLNKIEGNF